MNFESLLKQVGVADPQQRDQLLRAFRAMSAPSTENAIDDYRPRVSEVRSTLEKHLGYLKNEHNRILRALVNGGQVVPGEGTDVMSASASNKDTARPIILTAMQAAENKQNLPLLRQVIAQAARLGYKIPWDRPISLFDVDAAFAGKDIERRMACKSGMYRLGLLPK